MVKPNDDHPSPILSDDALSVLLCLAHDGTDDTRKAMLLRFALMGDDTDRAPDLDRLRRNRSSFVTAL